MAAGDVGRERLVHRGDDRRAPGDASFERQIESAEHRATAWISHPRVSVVGDPPNAEGARHEAEQMRGLRSRGREDDVRRVAPDQPEEVRERLWEPRRPRLGLGRLLGPPPWRPARLEGRPASVADERLVWRTETCAQVARSDDAAGLRRRRTNPKSCSSARWCGCRRIRTHAEAPRVCGPTRRCTAGRGTPPAGCAGSSRRALAHRRAAHCLWLR